MNRSMIVTWENINILRKTCPRNSLAPQTSQLTWDWTRAFIVRPAMQNRIDLNPEIPTFTTLYPCFRSYLGQITNKVPALLLEGVSLIFYVFHNLYNQKPKIMILH